MKLELIKLDNGEEVNVSTTAYELLTFAETNSASSKQYPFVFSENRSHVERTLILGSESFTGGTFQDLFRFPDMIKFHQAKNKLKDSGLIGKISQKVGSINRRKRRLSEHDGEWDESRKWEIEPFYNARRTKTDNRILEIDVHINVSADISADKIAEFGHMVWAINDLIESCGINTKITLKSRSINTADYSANNLNVSIDTVLKNPGEYVNPLTIAKCLSPNFLRRIIFQWFIIGCDYAQRTASEGLGTPNHRYETIKFEQGKLIITTEAIRLNNDVFIQEEILKAIMGDKK